MNDEELKKIFYSKKQTPYKRGFVSTKFPQFRAWFQSSNFDKGCNYCGTTNERSKELYDWQQTGKRPDASRKGKRGKRLELDRKDPFLDYDALDNLVWCCYWCNNAKSNFFTEKEFEPVAKAIGTAIKNLKTL